MYVMIQPILLAYGYDMRLSSFGINPVRPPSSNILPKASDCLKYYPSITHVDIAQSLLHLFPLFHCFPMDWVIIAKISKAVALFLQDIQQ